MTEITPRIRGALEHLQVELGSPIPQAQVEQLLANESTRQQLDRIGIDLLDDAGNDVDGVGLDAQRQLLTLLRAPTPAPPPPGGQVSPAAPTNGPGGPETAEDTDSMFDGLRNFARENPGMAGGILGALVGLVATIFTGGAALPLMLAGGAALGFGAGKFGLLDGLFGRESAQPPPEDAARQPPPEQRPERLPNGSPVPVA